MSCVRYYREGGGGGGALTASTAMPATRTTFKPVRPVCSAAPASSLSARHPRRPFLHSYTHPVFTKYPPQHHEYAFVHWPPYESLMFSPPVVLTMADVKSGTAGALGRYFQKQHYSLHRFGACARGSPSTKNMRADYQDQDLGWG